MEQQLSTRSSTLIYAAVLLSPGLQHNRSVPIVPVSSVPSVQVHRSVLSGADDLPTAKPAPPCCFADAKLDNDVKKRISKPPISKLKVNFCNLIGQVVAQR